MTRLVATLNKFGDIRCPQDDCNANVITPLNVYHVPGIGICDCCGREFELTQEEINEVCYRS